MTLRPEYSLGHSEYNAFLFASVGEEKTGLPLTVQTALIRLGFDPWQEAARLSDLPRETAVRTLAATMARLPEGDWKAAALPEIAARLVNCLPGRSAPAIASPGVERRQPERPQPERSQAERPQVKKTKPDVTTWLVWVALAIALFSGALYLQGNDEFEPAPSNSSSTQQ
jgi:hypothetical protein